ncbi:sirohydrochlorin cobaltochelatase [Vibrio sp. HA2012]|uniref:sirohydrochlorin cobaltochelatase n=1 Tax=Vibrio sp. HA2012 TaxID=1971595 RepID=UPI000C2B9F82|nr:sirohydrochlorin cobaltochelatase [Vibrio sp. HA2012]PJC87402.1 sirohydrochlorin cobaltochelatase [Vibrio sp. HA2012]
MKKALLIISFGTSYPGARKLNIDACEKELAQHYPDRDCFRAFTSSMIIRKLSQRDGLDIDTPQQALERLKREGYRDVLIQSLHIINGDEYDKIVRQVENYQSIFDYLQLGLPLLSGIEDYEQLIGAVKCQSPALLADERLVLMGHGATHHAFSAYACLDHMMRSKGLPFIVGAVESYPEIDTVIKRLIQEKVRKVYLMPLMLVAGDHAINDMASDETDSWKTLIWNAGIEAEPIVQGLGENPKIRGMFVQHLKAAAGKICLPEDKVA